MIPVILSGGSGTRLWPVSRASYPKQFCEFFDQSFLQNSVERLQHFGSPYILTVDSMRSLTQRISGQLSIAPDHLIFEPMGKNTAPAIALMCLILERQGHANEVVGIFPSDHLIADTEVFKSAVELAALCAEKHSTIVTLGIQARYPATGFGYIEVEDSAIESKGSLKAFGVKAFLEKPKLQKAEEFVQTGKHFWNAGMFVFKVSQMIEHFKKLEPEIWKGISEIKPDLSNAKYQYANLKSNSFDYAIMEKLKGQICIPCDMGWSDVGSWDELARLSEEAPALQRQTSAMVFSEDASSNYVFSMRGKVVGLVGVQDLIVVETPDALLISKKGQSEKVKNLLDQIKFQGLPAATEHPFELRPWGKFEILADASDFKAKTITVDPGQQLSYQSHKKREEHWIVIQGEAEVILNEVTHPVKKGGYIHIPLGAKHRIKNPGHLPLVFVEVQTGSYFGEDDIERFEDNYNRV